MASFISCSLWVFMHPVLPSVSEKDVHFWFRSFLWDAHGLLLWYVLTEFWQKVKHYKLKNISWYFYQQSHHQHTPMPSSIGSHACPSHNTIFTMFDQSCGMLWLIFNLISSLQSIRTGQDFLDVFEQSLIWPFCAWASTVDCILRCLLIISCTL